MGRRGKFHQILLSPGRRNVWETLKVRLLPIFLHKYIIIITLLDFYCMSYKHLYAFTCLNMNNFQCSYLPEMKE